MKQMTLAIFVTIFSPVMSFAAQNSSSGSQGNSGLKLDEQYIQAKMAECEAIDNPWVKLEQNRIDEILKRGPESYPQATNFDRYECFAKVMEEFSAMSEIVRTEFPLDKENSGAEEDIQFDAKTSEKAARGAK